MTESAAIGTPSPVERVDASSASPVERVEVAAVNKKENRSLYKKREKIHPKRARGRFRQVKWGVMAATLAVYYLVPWLRWDRGPAMPDQAVLLDIPERRFYFFFIEIWPQEVYYLTGLLILASLGLFLVTALAGRVWCGYTCPQTVWTDLFIQIERWVEGDRGQRIRLDKAPMSASKLGRRTIKHVLWLLVAMATGGAWVFYFADAPTLLVDLVTLQAPPVAYTTVAILTFTTYVFGGFMREQVCTYMCPWPRIQAALTDEESLIVSYKDDRGEPRGAYRKGSSWEGRGDCIDCRQCVVVCPMGIDIRDGQQLECISCALCIDACDDVMARIGRPPSLIGYDTLLNHDRRKAGQPMRTRVLRARTVAYAAAIVLVGVIMLAGLVTRSPLEVNVLHERNPLFVPLSDGSIRNDFTVKILNKTHEERVFDLAVEGVDGAEIRARGVADVAEGLPVGSDRLGAFRVFVSAPADRLADGGTAMTFVVTDRTTGETARRDDVFRGPPR